MKSLSIWPFMMLILLSSFAFGAATSEISSGGGVSQDNSPEAFIEALLSEDVETFLTIVERGLDKEHAKALAWKIHSRGERVKFIEFCTKHIKGPDFYSFVFKDSYYIGSPESSLLMIIFKQYKEQLHLLLEAGANLNDTLLRDKEPLLCSVAVDGDFDSARLLLDHKAELDAVDRYGNTALCVAANTYGEPWSGQSYEGMFEIVKLLVSRKAAVDRKNRRGETALFRAVCTNNLDATACLLSASEYDIDHVYSIRTCLGSFSTLLMEAESSEMVSLLVLVKADVDQEVKEFRNPSRKTTALRDALIRPKFEVVKALLACGANPNKKLRGQSVFHQAIERPVLGGMTMERQDIVWSLLEAGADLSIKADNGSYHDVMNPECVAAGNEESLRILSLWRKQLKLNQERLQASFVEDSEGSIEEVGLTTLLCLGRPFRWAYSDISRAVLSYLYSPYVLTSSVVPGVKMVFWKRYRPLRPTREECLALSASDEALAQGCGAAADPE